MVRKNATSSFVIGNGNGVGPTHDKEEVNMPMTLRRSLQFALALVASSFVVRQALPQAKAQEAGWITLFDGKDLEQWDQVGNSNWHLADGTVIADKMDGEEA